MLLIFDLDGTLFQAKPVVLLAVTRLFKKLDAPLPSEGAILKNAGRGAVKMLLGVLPDGISASAVMPLYYQQMRAAILESGELFPGVKEALAMLSSDGHELVICSNSPMIYIELVLKHTGISGYFSRCYSTEGYASKAARVKDILPHGMPAAVIGDTHGDVSAAHDNNLPAIAASYGYGNKGMLAAADYFAAEPLEIADCVRALMA